jgi:lipoyl(octanoyl) transferase
MSLFDELIVYDDGEPRAAALSMAVDEALLESVTVPTIRFYRWRRPSLSFGYFGRYVDVAPHESEREIVRRWTGGGTVFHGEDLTYSVIIPASDPLFSESSMSIYQKIHRAIQKVLVAIDRQAELASAAAVDDRRNRTDSTVGDRRYNGDACFANPVRADVMVDGRKVAGGAQRRTRLGILHQGSIHLDVLPDGFAEEFSAALGNSLRREPLSATTMQRAQTIADRKYGTAEWLRRR